MDLSLVEQHYVVFPDLALFNTWANKSQGDSEYWRKVSSGKLHQGQGSLTLSGGCPPCDPLCLTPRGNYLLP